MFEVLSFWFSYRKKIVFFTYWVDTRDPVRNETRKWEFPDRLGGGLGMYPRFRSAAPLEMEVLEDFEGFKSAKLKKSKQCTPRCIMSRIADSKF